MCVSLEERAPQSDAKLAPAAVMVSAEKVAGRKEPECEVVKGAPVEDLSSTHDHNPVLS